MTLKMKKKKNINEEIFFEFFNYPSFLVKYVYEHNQNENEKIVKNINESLIDLRSSINEKKIPENESPKNIVNIAQKFWTFIKNKRVMDFLRT